jgi:5-methylcytosine-specific restriction endonuclease McrA
MGLAMITATCKVCRATFSRYRSQMGAGFCSYACREGARRARRQRSGEARCTACGLWKALDQFSKINDSNPKRSKDAVRNKCRKCSSKDPASWRPAFRLTDEQRAQRVRDKSRLARIARRATGPKPGKFDIGKILCLQDMKCAYCGQEISGLYHIDHKHPVSRGGTNDPENLQATCPKCNMRKGAMTHEEFLVSKRRRVVNWSKT